MGLTKPRAYQIYDLDYKQSVRVVTVTNITLSGGAPSSVDGVNLSLNDRILVTGQSTGSQNGIYYVTTVGSGSNGTWTRSGDTNQTGELDSGTIVMVTEGNIYADTQWKLITDDPIVIGSSELIFVQNYSANSITSGTSNVVVADNSNVSIAVGGSNLVVFSTGTQNITANIIPTANVTYNLGNATNRFNDLYLANNSIFLGNVTLAATSTGLTVNGSSVITSSDTSTLSLTGNITGGNINGVGGTFTGNVAFGNIFVGGYYYANGVIFSGGGGGTPGGANTQIQFNDNGAFGGSAGLTFNKTTNAVTTTGTFSATGNITGGNLSGTSISGTLTTVAQPNITSVGTLGSLAVTGNTSSGNFIGTLNGSGANVTSINANNISAGTLAQARLANTSITIGNTTATLGATVTTITGLSSVTSTTFVGALTGAATTAGTVTTAAQPNITSVGTLSSLAVTGNVSGNFFIGNGSALTGIVAGLTWTTQANTAPSSPKPGDFWYDSFADIKYQYTNDGTSNVWIDQSYPTSFSTLTVQNIVNGGANGTGNIGTAGGYFNTAFVKATSAQYADLAEIYEADGDYEPGTVVVFGGDKEITVTDQSHDTRVAGVISTDPAFIMNSHAAGLPVAFTGRVPCRVQGPVTKGDVLVTSSIPGIAQKLGYNFQPGCVLGKSLGIIMNNSIQTIEVVVGRF